MGIPTNDNMLLDSCAGRGWRFHSLNCLWSLDFRVSLLYIIFIFILLFYFLFFKKRSRRMVEGPLDPSSKSVIVLVVTQKKIQEFPWVAQTCPLRPNFDHKSTPDPKLVKTLIRVFSDLNKLVLSIWSQNGQNPYESFLRPKQTCSKHLKPKEAKSILNRIHYLRPLFC